MKRVLTSMTIGACLLAIAPALADDGFQVAYGVLDHRGKIISGTGFKTKASVKRGVTNLKFEEFEHPAAVFATPISEEPDLIRLTKEYKKKDRDDHVQLDAYYINPVVGGEPEHRSVGFSFVAIAKADLNPDELRTKYGPLLHENQVQVATFIIEEYSVGQYATRQSNNVLYSGYDEQNGYSLVFTTPFSNGLPAVIATYNGVVNPSDQGTTAHPTEPIRTVVVSEISEVGAYVKIFDENGQRVQAGFNLIAIGQAGFDVDEGLLSQANVKYGRYSKNSGSSTFDEGLGPSTKTDPASYSVKVNTPFANEPYVVGIPEHDREKHVRQIQVSGDLDTLTLQVAGRTICCTEGHGNDARFDILAIDPNP